MLDSLFKPKSVAVIGASSKKLHIGNRIIRNLLDFGYTGCIYPINKKADEICGLRAYKSILDVSNDIDVAHIVIPAKFVSIAIEDCGKKGVKNVIINSGGFAETGIEGSAIQADFMEKAARYSVRVLGPNCQGIINSDKNIRAYCNFTFTFPKPGNISIVALSGGVAEVIHQGFVSKGIGTRMYASNGNACDITITEIIEYLGNDSNTHVIVTYVEGLDDLNNFMKVVKKITLKKPILAMKAGRTNEGAKAAVSHTGGLIKEHTSIEAIFKKIGVLSFKNESEMINAAIVLASQPMPAGNKVGIITNTGGPAVIATDILVESGFDIPELSLKTVELLKLKLHKEASIHNPVDLLATGTAEHYMQCLNAMISDQNIDIIFISFVTPFFVDTESIAQCIVEINAKKIKPIICNLMTDLKKWATTKKILKDGNVPCFDLPSDTAKAIRVFNQYRDILDSSSGVVKKYNSVNYKVVYEILSKIKNEKEKYLSAEQTYKILNAYGINSPKWQVANGVNNAIKIANNIEYPIVVKVDANSIIHKSDIGGVALNINSESDLKKTIKNMKNRIKNENLNFLIQKYMPSEIELIIGAIRESCVGHTIMFGLGGVFVEVFKDIVFDLTPLTNIEAINMVKSIKSYKIISGTRGRKGININLVAETLQRLSQLVTDFPQIQELDFNPVVNIDDSIFVLDARIIIK